MIVPSWVLPVLLPFVGAIPSSRITKNNIKTWYDLLVRPSWRPPNWAFGPVWSVLYTAMGVASHLVLQSPAADTTAALLYGAQLVLNWAWTPIFFGLHNVRLAAYEICLLWLAVAGCGLKFYSIDTTAGLLFLPYLAWVSLATALTFNIWRNNGDSPSPGGKQV